MSTVSKLASNALLTKSRAMNSGILTADDYSQLVNCRSLNDVVNYLKSNTVYSQAVDLLFGTNIYRARVEAEIKKFNNKRVADLASFEAAIGQKLHEIVFMTYDVRLILSCAYHLDTNEISDFSLFVPEAYFRHSLLKPEALEMAMSIEEFHAALEGTQYGKLLDIFISGGRPFTITALENVLYQYLYSRTEQIIKKNYSGDEEDELLRLFRAKADFKMLESIYRMKKFFPNEALGFHNIFYSGFSAFSKKEIQTLIDCESADKLRGIIENSEYGKYFRTGRDAPIEHRTRRALYEISEKALRFSTVPEVTMFSFINILENETHNLIHIIEGVRYSLSADEIMQFIVIQDN